MTSERSGLTFYWQRFNGLCRFMFRHPGSRERSSFARKTREHQGLEQARLVRVPCFVLRVTCVAKRWFPKRHRDTRFPTSTIIQLWHSQLLLFFVYPRFFFLSVSRFPSSTSFLSLHRSLSSLSTESVASRPVMRGIFDRSFLYGFSSGSRFYNGLNNRNERCMHFS